MICQVKGCNTNCHVDCKIPMGFEKVDVFKDCECFHWKVPKTIKVEAESHRTDLLCKVCDSELTFVDTEQGMKKYKETRVISRENFTINGVTVCGEPIEKTWLNPRFGSEAEMDAGWSVKRIRETPVPFQVNFSDWSNVEKGTGMLCKKCNHPLNEHVHQTTQWKKIREKKVIIDEHTKKKYENASSEVEGRKLLKDELDKKVELLAKEEKEVKEKLATNLNCFRELSGRSSYIGLLNEQKNYIKQLLKVASQEDNADMVSHLKEQLGMIETLKEATGQVPAPAAPAEPGIGAEQLGVIKSLTEATGQVPAPAAPAAPGIGAGAVTHHGFLSLRFHEGLHGKELLQFARDLKRALEIKHHTVFLCEALAGEDFGMSVLQALETMTYMVSFVTLDPPYGENTRNAYCTHAELKTAHEKKKKIIPVFLFDKPADQRMEAKLDQTLTQTNTDWARVLQNVLRGKRVVDASNWLVDANDTAQTVAAEIDSSVRGPGVAAAAAAPPAAAYVADSST